MSAHYFICQHYPHQHLIPHRTSFIGHCNECFVGQKYPRFSHTFQKNINYFHFHRLILLPYQLLISISLTIEIYPGKVGRLSIVILFKIYIGPQACTLNPHTREKIFEGVR